MLFLTSPQPSLSNTCPAAIHPGCPAGLVPVRRYGHPLGRACGSQHPPPAEPTHTPHVSLPLHSPREALSSPKCLSKGCSNHPPPQRWGDGASLPAMSEDDGQGSKGFSFTSSTHHFPRERLCNSAGGSQSHRQS